MGLAYEFDWSVLWRYPYGMWLLKGLGLTIFIGLTAWFIALAVGITVGTLRITQYRILRSTGTVYVEILRNIPLLVQMFCWFYAGPMLFGESLSREINRISGLNIYVSIFGLGLYTASKQRPVPGGIVHRYEPGADVSPRDHSLRSSADHSTFGYRVFNRF
jgi:glutamate/aspartate transport system permease protein